MSEEAKLAAQLTAVRDAFFGERWWTLEQGAELTGLSEATVRKRLNDLRKAEHGPYDVERRAQNGSKGIAEWRVLEPQPEEPKGKGGKKKWRRPATKTLFEGTKEIAAHLKYCEHNGRPVTKAAKKVLDWLYSEIGI